MNELELCSLIRDRLEQDLADLLLPNKETTFDPAGNIPEGAVAAQIIDAYLPPKRSTDKDDFPYVIVRPADGDTGTNRMSMVDVKLLIGCYSERIDGHQYCMQVMAAIRRSFMERPYIGSVFRFELPFSWKLFDDQPYPEWILEVTTKWSVATPLEEFDEGV